MPLLVLKFGGTSVGSCEKIIKVAKLIKKYHEKKNKVIVVSSAMTGVQTCALPISTSTTHIQQRKVIQWVF